MSSTSNALVLANYSFRERGDLTHITSHPDITQQRNNFAEVDVGKTMDSLILVGDLLRLAYAGSKGTNTCPKVVAIMADYQTLLKNSSVASFAFIEATLQALRFHKMADRTLGNEQIEPALKILSKCGERAHQMAEGAGVLAQEARQLCDKAREALVQAHEDEDLSNEERQKVQKVLHETTSQQANLQSQAQDLEQRVREELEKERRAERQAAKEVNRAFIKQCIKTALTPQTLLTETSFQKSDAEKRTEARLDEITKQRFALQTAYREARAKLAGSIKKLEGLQLEKNSLERTIVALDITIRTLGQVQTAFQNTRLFWMQVENYCKKLVDVEVHQILGENGLIEELREEVVTSALSWAVLGEINVRAYDTLEGVNNKFDTTMTTLPGEEEAREIVASVTTGLAQQLTLTEWT